LKSSSCQAELPVINGKRVLHNKEVITEQLKREMGLHDDKGRLSHGYLDAKWMARCDELMAEDSCFL